MRRSSYGSWFETDSSNAPHVWAALALYLLLAVLLTWPLVTVLGSQLPLGSLPDPTVPYFNLWTLAWNADRLVHGFRDYWDAPLFYPAHDTFALSEPQGLTGLCFAPLAACFGRIAAYDMVLLGLLCGNAAAGRHWLRTAGASQLGSTLGGALFLGLPYVRRELGVLQLCAAWPVILGLREITLLARAPKPWALVRLGLWTVATAWSCIYYVLFLGLFVLLALAMTLRRELFTWRMVLAGALASALLGLGIMPLVAAEQRAVSGYQRSAETIRSGSASVTAYLQLPRDTPLAYLLPSFTRHGHKRALYPGLVMAGLAVLGATQLRRLQLQRLRRFTLVGLVLALWLSFGSRLHLGPFEPYAFVEKTLPGFGQLRSPYRAALFVQLLLALLAGLGLDRLVTLAVAQRLSLARVVPWVAVGLALFEVTPWYEPLTRFPEAALVEPWIPWLRAQPAGPVAMVPPNAGGRAADYEDTVLGMLQALEHGHALVNGYSGFVPFATQRLITHLRRFPSRDSMTALREIGARYVVVDRQWSGAKALGDLKSLGLTRVFHAGRRDVFLLESAHHEVSRGAQQRQ